MICSLILIIGFVIMAYLLELLDMNSPSHFKFARISAEDDICSCLGNTYNSF